MTNIKNTIGSRIKLARKSVGLTQEELAEKLGVTFQAISSWERDEFIPDTWNLIELAKVLEVSVSSLVEDRNNYTFNTVKNIYNWEHMKAYVQTTAKALKLNNTLKALDFALKAHKGQTRKRSDIPYIYHPLNLACHVLAMNINDDAIISACLLHDVVEDCDIQLNELPVNEETRQIVDLLTHKESKNKEDGLKKYYNNISISPKAALIKLVDRCNNLTTMSWGLSRDKIYEYIFETETYILPLLNVIKNTEYDNAKWLLSYQIKAMLDIYKRLM